MSSANQGPVSGFPPIGSPKARTSKQINWLVLALVVLVCGIPGLGLHWVRQYYRVFSIPSSSMEPTIRLGEHILADMHYFDDHKPERGDVAIIQRPKILVIKRVIGLPGDTVEGREGAVFVNGTALSEPYAMYSASEPLYSSRTFGPTKLDAGDYFVLGDNRDNSLDSRHPQFGPVPLTNIIGRPLYILTSQERDRAWKRIQ